MFIFKSFIIHVHADCNRTEMDFCFVAKFAAVGIFPEKINATCFICAWKLAMLRLSVESSLRQNKHSSFIHVLFRFVPFFRF